MTADQDMPNTVGEEAAFWAAQRELPHGAERPEPEPRRFPWGIVITAIIGIGFSLFLFGYANASEPRKQAVHVIWNETTDTQAHAHQFTSPAACNMDLGGVAKTLPDGSRLSCRRIDQRRAQ